MNSYLIILLFYAIGLAIGWYVKHPHIIRGFQGYAVIDEKDGVVEKVYDGANDAHARKNYLTNVFALELLKGEPHFPTLFYADPQERKVVTNYCGKVLNAHNLPDNWREQVSEIQQTAEKYHIDFIDTGMGNFTVKDNIIYWVDLGSVVVRRYCTHPTVECEPFKDNSTLVKIFEKRYTN